MEKNRAIPNGYMRIGEIAKKAGVTVRTLSYYDKEGLLTPSSESEGGYRLYTDKDVARLMQILMLKDIGFTLSEIKNKLVAMDTTAGVVEAITEHAATVRNEIEHLTESLNALEALKAEILQVEAVNFKKFASILVNLRVKDSRYWLIKYLDDDVLGVLCANVSAEKHIEITAAINELFSEAAALCEEGVLPDSGEGQKIADKLWEMLTKITGGNTDAIKKLMYQMKNAAIDENYNETIESPHKFLEAALEVYMANLNDGGNNND